MAKLKNSNGSTTENPRNQSVKFKKRHYMKVPIVMFQGFLENPKETINDWFLYNLAEYAFTQNGEAGLCIDGYLDAINHYKLHGNKINFELDYVRASELFFSIERDEPYVQILWGKAYEFYALPKKEIDYLSLLAYMAIKSLLGSRKMLKINDNMLFGRMAGHRYADAAMFGIPYELDKHRSRRKVDKLKANLMKNWYVSIYGYRLRGYYVSQFIKQDDLKRRVESMRESNKKYQRLEDDLGSDVAGSF